jgi:hypothetical protein
MTTTQLKAILHESIENIDDEVVLKTIAEISSHYYSMVKEPELNEYQLKRLSESKKQIAEGKFFSNEQASELIKKWLNK